MNNEIDMKNWYENWCGNWYENWYEKLIRVLMCIGWIIVVILIIMNDEIDVKFNWYEN